MKSGQRFELEQFWNVVKTVFSEDNPCKISNLEKKTGLKRHHLNSFMTYLKDVGLGIELFDQGGESWVSIPHKPKITLELDLMEWLEMQSILPWISSLADSDKRLSMEKLFERLESDFESHDHFGAFQSLETKFHYLKSGHGIVLKIIEEQILKDKCVTIKLLEGEQVDIKPLKTVEISSELMIIAEDFTHKCLTCYGIADITSVEVIDKDHLSSYTSQEIDKFINQLSAIDIESVRLVLRFKDCRPEDFVQPPFETNGRPFVIENKEDTFIWAATVDPSDDIYKWLSGLGEKVSVLGPDDFIKEYISFCETKLKKIA